MNPYLPFASAVARLIAEGRSLPLGGIPTPERPAPNPSAPVALIFSPHPDDECIVGGLALRLMRQGGMRIVNIGVTLGSDPARRQARWQELAAACGWIGFELEPAAPGGLERINPKSRESDRQHWQAATTAIVSVLQRHQPRVIFFPHERDWNTTHIGTHLLVMDALKSMSAGFECGVVETEFWAQMPAPNLMVALSVEEVADLLAALSFHVGEMQRNPYHLRLPAWLADNVRRGAEWIGGQGGAAPEYPFATLYRLRHWRRGKLQEVLDGGCAIGLGEPPSAVLPDWAGTHH